VGGASLLAVLGTKGDNPRYWLGAGQALGRVLLRAAAAGIAASFLNQPIQVAALRPRLRELVGSAHYPQVLLRLGYGQAVPPTPRRQLIDDARQLLRYHCPGATTPVFPRAIADQFTGDSMPQRQALTLEINSRLSRAV